GRPRRALALVTVPEESDERAEETLYQVLAGARAALDPLGVALVGGHTTSGDSLYDQAVAIVMRDGKASTSYIQRRLSIGYNRAATLIERMEDEGVVGPANHAGKREILVGDGSGAEQPY
ncbi:MAG: hypothetical protein MI861_10680, partial [Pirellulales bacterium]|nr:hypothetical protein [Pirellulales bacterium]